MINQRAYPNVLLGHGTGNQTIAGFGCYMVSVLQGLMDRGYSYSVVQWNELLKSRGAFVNKTSLSSTLLAQVCPDIFLEGRNEAWNDANIIKYLVSQKDDYVVLGEVDARGIGGSGQHFVYIQKLDVSNGKVTMTYIGDPWDGHNMAKVTNRYNVYGNIKSLRVFKIKKKGGDMSTITVNKSDWDRLMKASQLGDRLTVGLGGALEKSGDALYKGNIADKSEQQIDQMIAQVKSERDAKKSCESGKAKAIEDAKKEGYIEGYSKGEKEGYDKGYAKGKLEGGSTSPTPEVPAGFDLNGYQTEQVINGVTVRKNYAKKG